MRTSPARPSTRETTGAAPSLPAFVAAVLSLSVRQIVPLRHVLAAHLILLAGAVAVLLGVSAFTGTPTALLTRDALATLGGKFYIGMLSTLGGLVWAGATAIAAFGALAQPAGASERRGLLWAAASLTLMLGLDDIYMLHETVYPKLGLEEAAVVALYAVGMASLVLYFRALILRTDVLLLVLAGLLLGFSVAVDLFVRDQTALEDVPKVAGAAMWLTWLARVALAGIRGER